MRIRNYKKYKMRGLTVTNGAEAWADLRLEFEGKRAFVIWSSIPVGAYEFNSRLEIDPRLLKRAKKRGCDYFYRGTLKLPRPENN